MSDATQQVIWDAAPQAPPDNVKWDDEKESEASLVANRPNKTAPVPLPYTDRRIEEITGAPSSPLAKPVPLGPYGTGMNSKSAVEDVSDAYKSGGWKRAAHTGIVDASEAFAPLLIPAAAAAPLATAVSLGAGMVGQQAGKSSAEALGASEDTANLVGDASALAAGYGASRVTPENIGSTVQSVKDSIGKVMRTEPTVDTVPLKGNLDQPKKFSTLKPGIKAVASLGKLVGGPEVANAIVPEHPTKIGPFKRIASGPIPDTSFPVRTVEPTGTSGTPVERNGVNLIPEPRNPVPSDRPGSMWSLRRSKELPDAARRGTPGAGEVLQNIGKPVIIIPRGADIESPKLSPKVEIANPEPPPAIPERRSPANAEQRRRMSEMSPEEMRKELSTSTVTDLPNRRAFDEAGDSPAVGISDVDGLKALNDKFGYDAGDALLKAKADALKEAGVDAYHDKGDEFLYRGDEPQALTAKLEKARELLRNQVIDVTRKDGSVISFRGADFSYGADTEISGAEEKLKSHKAQREARGERSRGELRGITEVGPQNR